MNLTKAQKVRINNFIICCRTRLFITHNTVAKKPKYSSNVHALRISPTAKALTGREVGRVSDSEGLELQLDRLKTD